MSNPMATQNSSAAQDLADAQPLTRQSDDFAALLTREFRPRSERAGEEVRLAVRTLAEQVLERSDIISDDLAQTINAYVAEIDRKITEQLNLILHAPQFQALEGAWRGLHYLVSNTESDTQLKIRVLNVSKKELAKNLKRFKGTAWDQSPVFKKIYEAEYGQLGGEPYGCLIGDYHFDHSPQDVDTLRGISQIAAASHAPFIAAAGPGLMGMESWSELSNPRDLAKIFSTPDYAAWRSLRQSEDAKYLALAMPRTLARLPYGAKTDPVEAFDFEEDTQGADSSRYTWQNAAYAMAVNINRSFKQYGWCTRIRGVESGGAVEGLPTHTFPADDGGVDMKCPTEVAITDRRSAELDKMGLMPLVHRKNTDMAAFIGAQSLGKPEEYDDPDATANAALSARLPYMFACCRFAHYLKCIVRDKIGSFSTRQQMQSWLTDWVMNYVDGDPANSSEETKARKPLAAAEVVVEEVEGNPGYYTSKFYLRPHYQLEGLTVSLRLVSRLPSAQAA
ncbi:type VI secretion system contractile sheath large subunit [Xanthomonas campestris pv. zingibericola]|uniref:type VI secretion system contractile sheath large subunit n=1 Tax=Xanthomonas TaxID=338 RepID=UPI0004DF17FF|nr:type VI secretion system contractile sheath large subunit [Xanthomonas euvesicatoria]MBV6858279.1 type VI secretion system contractile sheath large subunit [Xanthomonas campestris pv. zingibericola]MCP3035954.1 type VI secretion system contractile sheath large subunit [Xanthomonas euvesicatoria pv. allii]